jgi:hypothetical protein
MVKIRILVFHEMVGATMNWENPKRTFWNYNSLLYIDGNLVLHRNMFGEWFLKWLKGVITSLCEILHEKKIVIP